MIYKGLMMAFLNQKTVHILFFGFAFVTGIHCASFSNEATMLGSLKSKKMKQTIKQTALPYADSSSIGSLVQDTSTIALIMQTLVEQNERIVNLERMLHRHSNINNNGELAGSSTQSASSAFTQTLHTSTNIDSPRSSVKVELPDYSVIKNTLDSLLVGHSCSDQLKESIAKKMTGKLGLSDVTALFEAAELHAVALQDEEDPKIMDGDLQWASEQLVFPDGEWTKFWKQHRDEFYRNLLFQAPSLMISLVSNIAKIIIMNR